MRAVESPKVAEQMRKLTQVPVDRVRKFLSVVVDVPIGDLSLKMSHRAIYVLGSTLLQARDQANKLANVYQQVENNLKKLIEKCEEQDVNQKEMLEDLKKAISPEVVKEQLEARIKAFEEKQKEKIEHD